MRKPWEIESDNKKLESNIKNTFWFLLTNRRHYIVLLSVFFLAQEGNTSQLLGMSLVVGEVASFLIEIPSSYLSDKRGHRNALIGAKICMLLSSIFYIVGSYHYMFFFVGGILMSCGFAFTSGTIQAFSYDTLRALKKEDQYSSIYGKIGGKVSFIQVFTFALFPVIAEYTSLLLPFIIGVVIDSIGLWVAVRMHTPKQEKVIATQDTKVEYIWFLKEKKFIIRAILVGVLGGSLVAFSKFREPYLLEIGMGMAYIGLVSAGSRVVRRGISHSKLYTVAKNYSIKKLVFIDVTLLFFYFFVGAFIHNYIIVGIIFAVTTGFRHAREVLYSKYMLDKYGKNGSKATMLSIVSQISSLIAIGGGLFFGYYTTLSMYFGPYKDAMIIRGIGAIIFTLILFILLKGFTTKSHTQHG